MFNQYAFIDQMDSKPNGLQRNRIPANLPETSRGNRKIESTPMGFQGGGIGNGSYMPFENSTLERRKEQQQQQQPFHPNQFHRDILKPQSSQIPVPLQSNYEGYFFEHNANYVYNAEKNLGLGVPQNSNMGFDRNGEVGQRRRCAGIVQSGFQGDPTNQYFFQNFETLNRIAEKEEEINRFMERNPVATRRDEVEKERLKDKKDFVRHQGGLSNNYNDLTPQQTRDNKNQSQTNHYVPNGRTMAIPKNLV